MPQWMTIAKILAKEASYRFSKNRGGSRILNSPLITNLIAIGIFTIFSIASAIYMTYTDPLIYNLHRLASITLVQLAIGIFSTLFIMMYNLHIIVTDRLIDTLTHLPIKTRDIKYALLFLNLYWGVFTEPFLFIPGALIYTYSIGNTLFILMGIEASIFSILLTLSLGFIAGSVSPRVSRHPLTRIISTLIWLIVMSISLLISGAGRTLVEYISINTEKILKLKLIKYAPPFSIVYQVYGELDLILTSLLGLIALWILLNYSTSIYWGSLFKTAPVKTAPTVTVNRGIDLSKPILTGWVYRDLKMIIRNPRFLASIIYLLIFPILMPLLVGFTAPGLNIKWITPLFILTIGSFSGVMVANLFIIEGEGAKILYTLPITRNNYIIGKTLTVLYLATLASIAIALYGYLVLEIYPAFIPLLCIIYIFSTYSSSLFISQVYINYIPRQPSAWTQYTFSHIGINLRILGIILTYIVLGGILATPLILKKLGEVGLININLHPILTNEITIYGGAIIILIILTITGLFTARRKSEPL